MKKTDFEYDTAKHEKFFYEQLSEQQKRLYAALKATEDINESYPVIKEDGSYPQALLQVMIRQGSGQIWDYAPGSRKVSELQMVIPVLYTAITDESIDSASIVQKYEKRRDIEISIREVKTLMDINVLRSKSCAMLKKELGIVLTACNTV